MDKTTNYHHLGGEHGYQEEAKFEDSLEIHAKVLEDYENIYSLSPTVQNGTNSSSSSSSDEASVSDSSVVSAEQQVQNGANEFDELFNGDFMEIWGAELDDLDNIEHALSQDDEDKLEEKKRFHEESEERKRNVFRNDTVEEEIEKVVNDSAPTTLFPGLFNSEPSLPAFSASFPYRLLGSTPQMLPLEVSQQMLKQRQLEQEQHQRVLSSSLPTTLGKESASTENENPKPSCFSPVRVPVVNVPNPVSELTNSFESFSTAPPPPPPPPLPLRSPQDSKGKRRARKSTKKTKLKRTGKWSEEENETLRRLANEYVKRGQEINFKAIVKEIPGRTPKQAKERWGSSLDPTIKSGKFTDEEEESLLEGMVVHGASWSKIAAEIPHRSEHSVKSKCRLLLGEKMKKSSQRAATKKGKEDNWTTSEVDQLKRLHAELEDDFETIALRLNTGRPPAVVERKVLAEGCMCVYCGLFVQELAGCKDESEKKDAWTKRKARTLLENRGSKASSSSGKRSRNENDISANFEMQTQIKELHKFYASNYAQIAHEMSEHDLTSEQVQEFLESNCKCESCRETRIKPRYRSLPSQYDSSEESDYECECKWEEEGVAMFTSAFVMQYDSDDDDDKEEEEEDLCDRLSSAFEVF